MDRISVAVANRGEIAVRVFKTAKKMGMRTIALYSDADGGAPFVRMADGAINIGPAQATKSYLNIDAVISRAIEAGANFIHPGYGFLAENDVFAEACAKAGITFVGPTPEVLRLMGSKDAAKKAALDASVPVLDGYHGEDQSDSAFIAAANKVGYPVIVKPVAGGGGKGMAVVNSDEELLPALAAGRRMGAAAFGDEGLLIERYLSGPRHIEVQVIADEHGSVIHLWERDCSLQRRHQKILEESPSPAIDDDLRSRITASAVALAKHVGYRNAGTVEFVLGQDSQFAFLEMNTRLQVEHPVTEMVTGLDLVELQLRVAMGEPLPLRQEEVKQVGHAIEVRVYAEDPKQDFLPQAGTIQHLKWPPSARVDTGIDEGGEVTSFYDPMIAKLIVHAPDRSAALQQIRDALDSTEVLGIGTNISFLRDLCDDPVVASGAITTTWLEGRSEPPSTQGDNESVNAIAAVAVADQILQAVDRLDPWSRLGTWRVGGPRPVIVPLVIDGDDSVFEVATDPYRVGNMVIARGTDHHAWSLGDRRAAAAVTAESVFVWWDSQQHEIARGPKVRRVGESGAAHLEAPMPGQVIAVDVAVGDKVKRGQALVVVEAMKMEHTITAPADGTVVSVMCSKGDQVQRGRVLIDIEAD